MKKVHAVVVVAALVAGGFWCGRAEAVGWDGDDFIITGAPHFPQYIGVFDHDFTFKGYLDNNFLGVAGMDFDAQGRLVADSLLTGEIRVYDPSGAKVGGFTQVGSPMLVPASDVKVAPDGDYVLGTSANGVRVFTPDGTFVRQYGDGKHAGVTLVPGNRLWAGDAGPTVSVFDYHTGEQIGGFATNQQVKSGLFRYYSSSNTVLMVDTDRDAGGVFERDLDGILLHQFHVPHAQISCTGATRGPGGDVYGTHDVYAPSYFDLVRWSGDGIVLDQKTLSPVEIKTVAVLWAGSVPEPGVAALMMTGINLLALRQGRRRRVRGR